jgi:Beta-1,3-glucanase
MKVSRRTMLAGSAAAVAAGLLGVAAPELRPSASGGAGGSANREGTRLAAHQTAATVSFTLRNNTGSDTVYAFVTGLSINDNNALVLLEADGQTLYYPSSPSAPGSPLAVNCAIPLGPSGGSPVTITVPQLAGARLWFSIGTPITFLLNPGPALVEPSVTNPSDPNINTAWDFAEFTYNSAQLFANISMVDFTCLPIGLTLTDTSGSTQSLAGLPAGGLDAVCSGLTAHQKADGNPWTDLIVASGGQNLRALSPQNGIVGNSSFLSGYYDSYVSQVWQMYESVTLTVDTQASYGTVTGQVSNGVLTFPGVGSFAQPTAADIFSCSTGPFSTAGASGEVLAIIPRLAAAFNRSTLLIDSSQPDGENPADYYANAVTNHYARIVHATLTGSLGYAFPYDDVTPNGGVNQSGPVSSGSPAQLTVTVGSPH